MSMYQILIISEKELDEMAVAKPNEKGLPKFGCMTKAGTFRFWPKPEIGKFNFFVQEEL